jgi:hypothetical protein
MTHVGSAVRASGSTRSGGQLPVIWGAFLFLATHDIPC